MKSSVQWVRMGTHFGLFLDSGAQPSLRLCLHIQEEQKKLFLTLKTYPKIYFAIK
jgi:hypothetical protein